MAFWYFFLSSWFGRVSRASCILQLHCSPHLQRDYATAAENSIVGLFTQLSLFIIMLDRQCRKLLLSEFKTCFFHFFLGFSNASSRATKLPALNVNYILVMIIIIEMKSEQKKELSRTMLDMKKQWLSVFLGKRATTRDDLQSFQARVQKKTFCRRLSEVIYMNLCISRHLARNSAEYFNWKWSVLRMNYHFCTSSWRIWCKR